MTVFLYILKWHDIPAMQVVCIYILHNDKKEKKKKCPSYQKGLPKKAGL